MLRDEAEQYAGRLRSAGVPVRVSRVPGMVHGFFGMGGLVDRADASIAEACAWLREALR